MEEFGDTHFCLRCKATIVGLENYVSHRKNNCIDKKIPSSKPTTENLTSRVDNQVNDFFTSLELQSTCSVPKNKIDEDNDEEMQQVSDDDEYVPPRTHTGGKWTPGTRPDLTNELFSNRPTTNTVICEQECVDKYLGVGLNSVTETEARPTWFQTQTGNSLQNHLHDRSHSCILQGKSKTGPDRSSNTSTQMMSFTECVRCRSSFSTKKDYAIHQISLEHKRKFSSEKQWLEDIHTFQKILINVFPYHCHICKIYYLHSEHLQRHVESSGHESTVTALEVPHFCHPCEYKCHSNDDMVDHLATEEHGFAAKITLHNHPVIIISENSKFNCLTCPQQQCILKKQTIPVHNNVLLSHKEGSNIFSGKFECADCDMNFESCAEHDRHVFLYHLDNKCCKSCNVVFASTVDFATHLHSQSHKKKLPQSSHHAGRFLCSTCLFTTDSEGEFAFHKIQHTEPVVVKQCESSVTKKLTTKYRCSFCSKAFFLSALKIHILSHTGEKPFSCQLCNKAFTQKGTLKLHMNCHQKTKFFYCEHCSYKTLYKSALRKHDSVHKEVQQKAFLCDVCGLSYTSRNSLSQHTLIHGHLKYKCDYKNCFYSFRTPSELEIHRAVHNNKRSFLCDICGYSMKSHHLLRKHQRRHTGEKPFKCPFCSYTAAMSNNMLRHLRLHSGSKPYKCPYCKYTCNNQENIRKHILKTKKHAGKMMYPCKHCAFACNEFQKYRAHLLERHHNLYSVNDKDIESSVVAGLYERDEPRKIIEPIQYPTQNKRHASVGKVCSTPETANPPVPVVNKSVVNNTVQQTTEMPAIISKSNVLSTLTPLILSSDNEVVDELKLNVKCKERTAEKDLTDSHFSVCTESSGDLFNTINFISNYVRLPVMVLPVQE